MTPLTQARDITADADRVRALAAYGILDTPPEQEFEDIAALAAELCGTPVALVSFVGPDRQWFKARVNFSPCETDLDRSVCRFVLAETDILVIDDLTQDERTRNNPLVTGEPHIRFYAGAPLRTPDAQVLGSLCVIDTQPRPGGLSSVQKENLRQLALQAMGQLEVRRLLKERDAAIVEQHAATEAVARSEAHWRGVFENLREGFVLAQAVRDASGVVCDWRYLEVNRAWSDLLTMDGRRVIGKTLREVMPGIEREWIDLAQVVDTGGSVTFTRKVGHLGRWYDGRASATGHDTFSILFLEATDRIQSGARQDALLRLGDAVRESASIGEMTQAAARIVGEALGVSRAGYGRVDDQVESVVIEPDWTEPGVASIAGSYRFEDFGRISDELKRGEPLVIADVLTDPRTAADPTPMQALGIAALVNMPVRQSGRTLGVFIVQSVEPRAWTGFELGFIRNVADRLEAGVSRLQAAAQQEIVNGEIVHRLKNTLTMVQAIATQTLRKDTPPEALRAFDQRLRALGRAHDALMRSNWATADLRDVVAQTLIGAAAEDRWRGGGPPVTLGARAALSTSLLLHELATNASKYGALSVEGGVVVVEWRLERGEHGHELVLTWREEGGPPAHPPMRRGFGSRLLSQGLVGTGGSHLGYEPSGFHAEFRAPMDQLTAA